VTADVLGDAPRGPAALAIASGCSAPGLRVDGLSRATPFPLGQHLRGWHQDLEAQGLGHLLEAPLGRTVIS